MELTMRSVDINGVVTNRRSWTFKQGDLVLFRGSSAFCKDCDWEKFRKAFTLVDDSLCRSNSSKDYGLMYVSLFTNRSIRSVPKTEVLILGGPEYLIRRESQNDSGEETVFYKILYPPTSLVVWVGDLSLSPL
jgi:hypothetical protein